MSEQPIDLKCPICGVQAEAGAPHWKNRLDPGLFLLGKSFAQVELVGAVCAEGLYCESCNPIVIPTVSPKNYFPAVKE